MFIALIHHDVVHGPPTTGDDDDRFPARRDALGARELAAEWRDSSLVRVRAPVRRSALGSRLLGLRA